MPHKAWMYGLLERAIMARLVGYTGPRWEIVDAGGALDLLMVGSGLEVLVVGEVWSSESEPLGVADDGALFL